MEYKVGDKVRIIDKQHGHEYKIGQIVTIDEVDERSYFGKERTNGRPWYFTDDECEIYTPTTPNQSIHITTDGMKTYGVMKCGNKVVKRVEAKCHEDDEFSFETGAKIVMDRLFDDENEKKIENDSTINVGDKVKIIDGGKAYTTYTEWVMQNCPEKAVYYRYNVYEANGIVGTVIKIAPHMITDIPLCYVETESNACYLIGIEGLEKVIG